MAKLLLLCILLNVSQQHLRKADNLEHFLTNKAKHLSEDVHRECYRKLVEVYTAKGVTFQVCDPVIQYGLGLVDISLESRLEEFNNQKPGFPRTVKIVQTEVAGKKFVLILFYSTLGFPEDMALKLQTLKLVVKNYNPKIFLEIVKGFIGSYAETFGNKFVFVSKPYQRLSNFNLYKYTLKARTD